MLTINLAESLTVMLVAFCVSTIAIIFIKFHLDVNLHTLYFWGSHKSCNRSRSFKKILILDPVLRCEDEKKKKLNFGQSC